MSQAVHDEKREILKASGVMASFTMLSRLLGLVRNQILSHFFGATLVADAFIAAFTIPNALRRLFGEGAITPAIVSIFTRVLKERGGAKNSKAFITASFWWLTAGILLTIGIGIAITPFLVRLYVPEFANIPGKTELTISLTRFLFPFILFVGWAAFFMGLLNTLRVYAISAFSPAMLNIAMIVFIPPILLSLQPEPQLGIFIFAGGILFGGALQAAVHWPSLKNRDATPGSISLKNDPHVKALSSLLLPSIVAMGTYQLNIIVNRIFASGVEGAVSHLFYADLLLELPVSLIAVSLGTAVSPTFSRFASEEDWKGLGETFRFSLEGALFLALPAMGGLIVLATPLCSTLYFSGKFDLHDLDQTSKCLIAYAVGLPLFASLRIVTPLFFALKDTKTPTIIGIIALAANYLAARYFSGLWGAWGIALATSVSSFVNLKLLMAIVFMKHPNFEWTRLAVSTIKMILCATIMGAALYNALPYVAEDLWRTSGISIWKIMVTALLVLLGVIVYGFACLLFKVEQAKPIARKIRAKLLRQ